MGHCVLFSLLGLNINLHPIEIVVFNNFTIKVPELTVYRGVHRSLSLQTYRVKLI